MKSNYELLDVVIAGLDVPEEQVLRGDLGTIVEIYDVPTRAYEVEFVNPDGSTRALLTLLPTQVRHLSEQDVLTTRTLAIAS